MLRAHHCSGVMKTWWDEAEREAQRDHPLSRHGGPYSIREEYLKFMQREPVGYGSTAGRQSAV